MLCPPDLLTKNNSYDNIKVLRTVRRKGLYMFGIIVVFVLLSVLGVSGWYIARRLYKGFACFFSGIKFWPVLTIVFFFILLLLLGFMRSMLPFPEGIKDIFSRIAQEEGIRVSGFHSSPIEGLVVYHV